MNIGYIGLGNMGGALAKRLSLSHRLHVFDVNTEALNEIVGLGGIPVASPAEMAGRCDMIMICVPRSANVEEVIFGQNGVIQGGGRTKIIVDQTSGDPAATRRMARLLEPQGIAMLDAPVSGGKLGAEAGTITIMAGGPDEVYEAVLPVLQSISPNTFHCGGIGSGQIMKLLNNTVSTTVRLATLEAVAIGMKNGLKLSTMTEVLHSGGARSRATENLLPMIVKGDRNASFAISLMLKDLNLCSQLAIDNGAPLAFGQLARSFLQMASNAHGPDADLHRFVDLIGDQAGVDIWSVGGADSVSTK